MDASTVEAVRDLVARVPQGRVTTYGTIARAVEGCGPRQVGRIVADHADDLPWWRVVRAGGTPAACHGGTAPELIRAEGTPMRGQRVDLDTALWRPDEAGG